MRFEALQPLLTVRHLCVRVVRLHQVYTFNGMEMRN